MPNPLVFILVLALWQVAIPVLADGLIYSLPADGTTVELVGRNEFELDFAGPKEIEDQLTPQAQATLRQKGTRLTTVTVSSVGRVTRAGQSCRWIELTMRSDDLEKPAEEASNVLKLLIPNKFLTRGEDPLSHSILTFFNPKEVDMMKRQPEPGFSRIQYEIDRFRSVFPDQINRPQQLPQLTITAPFGVFKDCEIISGVTKFDRPLLGGGRWAFKNIWQIALHPNAPFGVVETQCRYEGRELDEDGVGVHLKGTAKLSLSKTSKNAKSILPVKSSKQQAAHEK